MKTAIAMFVVLALVTLGGCAGTTQSRQGGIVAQDREFSITAPSSVTIAQGAGLPVSVVLNRGAQFKQDVVLDVQAEGISVSPSRVRVKASEHPTVQLQIAVGKDAALGEYRVYIKGTPETGKVVTVVLTVKAVAL